MHGQKNMKNTVFVWAVKLFAEFRYPTLRGLNTQPRCKARAECACGHDRESFTVRKALEE
jgi:hypothetical protein